MAGEMEFRVTVDDLGGGGGAAAAGGGGDNPNHPVTLSKAEMEQLVRAFGQEQAKLILQRGQIGGVPVAQAMAPTPQSAQEKRIEETLLPAVAAAAPQLAQQLRQQASAASHPAAEPGGLLPALEDLELASGRQAGDILPAEEDLAIEAMDPVVAAERAKAKARAQAARENLEQGPADVYEEAEEITDPYVAHAVKQRDAEKKAAKTRAARENLKDEEEGKEAPYVIDPRAEKMQEQAGKANEYLQGGARVAAQAGLGATGQALGGAADLGVGLATGNVFQAVSGGMELASAGAHAVAEGFQELSHAVDYVGHQLGSFAQNDYVGMFNNAAEQAVDVASKWPVVGEAYGAALEAAIAPVKNFTEVVDAFVQRGKQLEAYSPELSLAGARADLANTFGDIHEAMELGESLARMTDAETEIKEQLRELLLPVKKFLTEVLASIMENISTGVTGIRIVIEEVKEIISIQTDLFNDIFGSGRMTDIPALLGSIDTRLKKAAERAAEPDIHADALKILNEISRGLDLPGAPKNAAKDAIKAGLKIPGIEGGF